MLDLREQASEGPSFQAKVRKYEGKIRAINVNYGQALHDLERKAIYVF